MFQPLLEPLATHILLEESIKCLLESHYVVGISIQTLSPNQAERYLHSRPLFDRDIRLYLWALRICPGKLIKSGGLGKVLQKMGHLIWRWRIQVKREWKRFPDRRNSTCQGPAVGERVELTEGPENRTLWVEHEEQRGGHYRTRLESYSSIWGSFVVSHRSELGLVHQNEEEGFGKYSKELTKLKDVHRI